MNRVPFSFKKETKLIKEWNQGPLVYTIDNMENNKFTF